MSKCYYIGCPDQPDQYIYRIQKALAKAACLPDEPASFDGRYGPQTRDAAIKFQELHGLVPDGIVGPITIAALIPQDATSENLIRKKAPISALAEKAVEVALSFEGHKETGPNRSTLIDQWNRDLGVPLGSPWCCSFVQQCYKLAAKLLGFADRLKPDTAGVLNMWNRVDPSWRVKPTEGRRGDIFIMDFGGGLGHTGIVLSYADGWYETIEGNSNAEGSREGTLVRRNRRKHSALKGLVRVP